MTGRGIGDAGIGREGGNRDGLTFIDIKVFGGRYERIGRNRDATDHGMGCL
jgi:hypothetical protein